MRKKTIENLVDQLESAYNDKFEVKNIIKLRTRPVKYLADVSCRKAKSVGIIFSTNLFGTEVSNIEDSYMIRACSYEINSFVSDIVKPFLTCEYKIVFIPGSDVPLGTYNNRTPVETITRGLDEYDEFIILAKDEITPEMAEEIKQALESEGLKITVYLVDQVEPETYNCADEKYFDTNEIEGAGKNFFNIFYDGDKYSIKNE